MKRKETLVIEEILYKGLYGSNPRLAREYGAKEVTLGFARDNRIRGKTEIVDFLSYDMKKDIYKCYEIKISMQDFKSDARKSWYGNYNYLVISKDLYSQEKLDWWKKQIPKEIGIIVVNIESGRKENVKRSSYQDIPDDNKNILKNSLLRTLFYQNMKSSTLYNSK